MKLARFTAYYIAFGSFVAGIVWLIKFFLPNIHLFTSGFWAIYFFLFLLTYIAYVISFIGIKKNAQMGVFAIMGGIIIKLLFAMSFALVVILKLSENQLVFVLNYFSLYLLFTLFEVMCLLRNLRHQNNK